MSYPYNICNFKIIFKRINARNVNRHERGGNCHQPGPAERGPPLALITEIKSGEIDTAEDGEFVITPSDDSEQVGTMISPDITLCDDCRTELFEPADRRYRYPFINCTNCGPRYTIIESLPYDRPFTSMRKFAMCFTCQAEYDAPTDRRFHAQPNACPDCGPQLALHKVDGTPLECADPIRATADLLKQGMILAIKGLGGCL